MKKSVWLILGIIFILVILFISIGFIRDSKYYDVRLSSKSYGHPIVPSKLDSCPEGEITLDGFIYDCVLEGLGEIGCVENLKEQYSCPKDTICCLKSGGSCYNDADCSGGNLQNGCVIQYCHFLFGDLGECRTEVLPDGASCGNFDSGKRCSGGECITIPIVA